MIREAIKDLIIWKNGDHRKPLIIRGARQVGKTWIMKEFGRKHYERLAYINFENNERMEILFKEDLDISRIITALQIESGVTIEDLANKLNIGRTTLSNLINREEGVNFNTWINRLRIEEAKQLLIDNPDYTIAKISEMVGYTEQANFSRQFKQITGESPLLWRKQAAS